jgi:hypothetical protein
MMLFAWVGDGISGALVVVAVLVVVDEVVVPEMPTQ